MNQHYKDRSNSRERTSPVKVATLSNINRNHNQPIFQQKVVQQRTGAEIVHSNSLLSEKSHLRVMVSPSPQHIQPNRKVEYKHPAN
jgi:hypothetical protein